VPELNELVAEDEEAFSVLSGGVVVGVGFVLVLLVLLTACALLGFGRKCSFKWGGCGEEVFLFMAVLLVVPKAGLALREGGAN
jgi:hypothetical protein